MTPRCRIVRGWLIIAVNKSGALGRDAVYLASLTLRLAGRCRKSEGRSKGRSIPWPWRKPIAICSSACLRFRTGLIEQPDLIAALKHRSADRARPISEILVELGLITDEDRALLERLLERQLAKRDGDVQAGADTVPAIAVIAAGLRAAGVAERDLQDSLSSVDVAGGAETPTQAGHTVGMESYAESESMGSWSFDLGTSSSEGSRFRLLRRHARGGIGVVFVALDSELHREVALKQIQPQHADDPGSRELGFWSKPS